jgi:hypothetical protein
VLNSDGGGVLAWAPASVDVVNVARTISSFDVARMISDLRGTERQVRSETLRQKCKERARD